MLARLHSSFGQQYLPFVGAMSTLDDDTLPVCMWGRAGQVSCKSLPGFLAWGWGRGNFVPSTFDPSVDGVLLGLICTHGVSCVHGFDLHSCFSEVPFILEECAVMCPYYLHGFQPLMLPVVGSYFIERINTVHGCKTAVLA